MIASAAVLVGWTPYLLGGFAWNLVIAVLAMAAGTLLGAGLAWLRGLRGPGGRLPRRAAAVLALLCRNVPSFVLMFYVAFVLPVEIETAGGPVALPLWIKATLALTIPVTGFVADQALAYRRQAAEGMAHAGATFLVAWLQYFLIVLMASATASVIGADEIVARANRVIATDPRPEFVMAVYLYVSLWFLMAGVLVTAAAPRLGRLVEAHRRLLAYRFMI